MPRAPITESLLKEYPAEAKILQDILVNFAQIYKKVLPKSTEAPKEIKFAVAKDTNSKQYTLVGNEEAILFLVSICKTLLDIGDQALKSSEYKDHLEKIVQESTRQYITKFIKPINEEAFKRCPKCNYENKYNAVYCTKCAKKL